jgi:hypothetical protein
MTHMNISDPDHKPNFWRDMLEVDKLKAEIAVLQRERDHYRENLSSIFERIASDEEVYLNYSNGDRIWIVARPKEPTT